MQDKKQKQLEKALSRMGAGLAVAGDELLQAEKKVQGAAARLAAVQRELEQVYMTLEEPFMLFGPDE